ncbi:MAG: hypothetical protein NVS2B11_03210 [Acetobacteraceae bacterium]
MRRARTALLLAAAALSMAAAPADADWPCVQRLVASLTAATLWSGHAPKGDWHADPRIVALVREVADRRRPVEASAGALEAFVVTRPGSDALAQVFAGLVDASNADRNQAIERLRSIARRQRSLAEAAAHLTAELRSLPADAPAGQRDELGSRRTLIIREYEEVGRTIRYSCEIPVEFEARLGRFAQVLQHGLE